MVATTVWAPAEPVPHKTTIAIRMRADLVMTGPPAARRANFGRASILQEFAAREGSSLWHPHAVQHLLEGWPQRLKVRVGSNKDYVVDDARLAGKCGQAHSFRQLLPVLPHGGSAQPIQPPRRASVQRERLGAIGKPHGWICILNVGGEFPQRVIELITSGLRLKAADHYTVG